MSLTFMSTPAPASSGERMGCARHQVPTHAVQIIGAEKVLYGSEGLWPQAVLHTYLTEREKGLILGGNAIRLLGIKKPTAC